jgi:hypothetical protein
VQKILLTPAIRCHQTTSPTAGDRFYYLQRTQTALGFASQLLAQATCSTSITSMHLHLRALQRLPFLAQTTTLSPASKKSSASARPTPNTIHF